MYFLRDKTLKAVKNIFVKRTTNSKKLLQTKGKKYKIYF